MFVVLIYIANLYSDCASGSAIYMCLVKVKSGHEKLKMKCNTYRVA